MAARPRGGDWLEDEVAGWNRAGIDTVLSLLTPEEEQALDLAGEADAVKTGGMEFLSLPIPDRQVPTSETELTAAMEKVNARLAAGRGVLVHCRQGVGRSGLVAACLLVTRGVDPSAAVERVSAAREVAIPETREQRQWIDHYAAILASTK
ncbi:MAG TPA: dual specificity protein phosphatase family protein [Terriglobales bacterium]|nr:dual specificity protein phosphatase family protein [Terriglobales bacterium]